MSRSSSKCETLMTFTTGSILQKHDTVQQIFTIIKTRPNSCSIWKQHVATLLHSLEKPAAPVVTCCISWISLLRHAITQNISKAPFCFAISIIHSVLPKGPRAQVSKNMLREMFPSQQCFWFNSHPRTQLTIRKLMIDVISVKSYEFRSWNMQRKKSPPF